MALILPGNVASAAAGAYEVANSCRFNIADGAYMHYTPGSAGNLRTWTLSFWVKKTQLGVSGYILSCFVDSTHTVNVWLNDEEFLECQILDGSGNNFKFSTNRKFRDPSAWYHVVYAVDTTEGTAGDRVKIWINGTRETSFSSSTNPDQNTDSVLNGATKVEIGSYDNGDYFLGGYLAEVCLIDGQQLDADQFGEFDEDSPTIWKPIDVSGLTFGTNGFYLDFESSGNLGNDANGGTDLTEVNLAAADQATDTPTNNFCTFNVLDNFYPESTFSEGNMQVQTDSSAYTYTTSTFGVSTGKWYWEVEYDAKSGGSDWALVGITSNQSENNNSNWLGENQYDYSYYGLTGVTYTNNGSATYGDTFAPGDIVGVALNIDDNEIKFYKNNAVQNSGTAISIAAASSTNLGVYIPAICFFDASYNGTFKGNFGGCPAFALSSAAADENGYGNFEYAPPSGYLALCTKNLATDG